MQSSIMKILPNIVILISQQSEAPVMDHSSTSLNIILVPVWEKMTVKWLLANLPSQQIASTLYTLQVEEIFKSFKSEQQSRSSDPSREDEYKEN